MFPHKDDALSIHLEFGMKGARAGSNGIVSKY